MQSLGPMGDGPSLPGWAGYPADYQLRFFAPGLGIDEDPVTGSAHALVAPYWMERLGGPPWWAGNAPTVLGVWAVRPVLQA